MPIYQSSSTINRADTTDLVVHCGDHRFQAGIREFLDKGLNLGENYELLNMPGGAQCLTMLEYLPKFAWAGGRWFRYLMEHHKLTRMILIAHQDCRWYKSLPLHIRSSAEPRQRQEQDLRCARRSLIKDFPEIHVDLYYAGWDMNERVTVDPISA